MVSREDCLQQAKEAERLAAESDTEATREAFMAEAKRWRTLADAPDAERALINL